MSDESEEFSDGRLVIYDVTKEDAGEYECYNPLNGDKRRVRLVVLQSSGSRPSSGDDEPKNVGGLRQFQSKYRKEIEAYLGGSVEIFCEFKDEPRVEWRKVDGVRIRS